MHVVAAVDRLQVLGADAPIILEDPVLERPERRSDVARLQPPDVDLEPPQQVLVALDLQVVHHIPVDVRLGFVVGGRPVGHPAIDGGEDSFAGRHAFRPGQS